MLNVFFVLCMRGTRQGTIQLIGNLSLLPPPPTPLLRCRNKQIKHTYVVELSGRIIFVAYVVMLTVWAKNDDRFPLRQAWLRACKSRMLDDIEKYQTYKYN